MLKAEIIRNRVGFFQYLRKGVKVFVRGDLNAKVFTRRDGSQDISLSIMTRELQICQFEQHGQPLTNTHTLVNQTEQTSDDDDLPLLLMR